MATMDVLDADGVRQTIAKVPNTGTGVPQEDRGAVTAMIEGPALATAAAQATGNTALADILAKLSADPATQTTLAAILAKLSSDPATQTTLAAVLAKLSSDPATATLQGTGNTALASILAKLPTGGATDASVLAVRDAIRAQIDVASTIWTDNSGAFYVRRDLVNEGTGAITVAFTAPDGTAATPGAGLRPLSAVDRDVTQALFDVTTSGTGYSVGDLLARVAIIDANAATPTVTAIWVNLTTGAVISAPTSGHIERADETIGTRQVGTWNVGVTSLPASAASAANQDTANTRLTSIDTDIGALTDAAAPSNGTGDYSLIAAAKRTLQNWASLLSRIPAALGQGTMVQSLPVVIASNQSAISVDPTTNMVTVTGTPQSAVNTDLLTGTVNGWFDVRGYRSGSIQLIGGAGISSGNVVFEATNDTTNAASGQRIFVNGFNNGAASYSSIANAQFITAGAAWIYHVPILFSFLRVRINSAFLGGTVRATAQFSNSAVAPIMFGANSVFDINGGNPNLSVAAQFSANRIGYVGGNGVWYDDSNTTLAAGATFTGTSRDVYNASAGTPNVQGFNSFANEFRAFAVASHAGTVFVEVSRDNTTWQRAFEQATTATTGGLHVAVLRAPILTRYYRVVYTNGGTNQSTFLLQTFVMGI